MNKLNIYKLFALIFLQSMLFITTSCEKNLLSNKLEGEVFGLTEGLPIQGATVTVYRRQSGGLMMPSTYETVMQTQTDPKGKFYLDFKQEVGEYILYVKKEGFFDYDDDREIKSTFEFSIFGNVFKRKKKFYLQEPAYLNISLNNVSNYDTTHSISFSKVGLKEYTLLLKRCFPGVKSYCCFLIPANKIFVDNYDISNSQGQIVFKEFSIPPAKAFSTIDYELKY